MTIKTVIETLKSATELIGKVNQLQTDADLLAVKAELLKLIFDAREEMMELQVQYSAILSRCTELESQLLAKDQFAQEKQNYHLHRFASGGLVYRFQPPDNSNIPAHDLCAHCFQNNVKSILQFNGYENAFHKYSCPRCQTVVLGERLKSDVEAISTGGTRFGKWTDGY